MLFSELEQLAEVLVKKSHQNDPLGLLTIPQESVKLLKQPTDLEVLVERTRDAQRDTNQSLIFIEASLRNPTGFSHLGIAKPCTELRNWCIKELEVPSFFASRGYFDDDNSKDLGQRKHRWRQLAFVGVRLLQRLDELQADHDSSVDEIACLAALTDHRDSWASQATVEDASGLLAKFRNRVPDPKFQQFVVGVIQHFVRPRFSKSGHSAITEQGRKAINEPPKFSYGYIADEENKPWKFKAPATVTIFAWVVRCLDTATIEANWPLITPALLTILDDDGIQQKCRGCELLSLFLTKAPLPLLRRSGLDDVFEEAVMPCLSYLPTLTPENESEQMLDVAYPALITLAKTRNDDDGKECKRLLDKMLRGGVFQGMQHAGENVKVSRCLLAHLCDVLPAMGIQSVKHLKYLVPLLSEVVSGPYAVAHPPRLLQGLAALQQVLLNAWPRIPRWSGEIMKVVSLCWIQVGEELVPKDETQTIKESLRTCIQILRAILASDPTAAAQLEEFLKSNDRVSDLG